MHITSEAPWDPKVLDHVPSIKWHKEQLQSLKLIKESLFDQHGEYKDSSSPVSEKEDKVLDAETPTDDPNCGNTTIETSKSDMRAHLHTLVRGEIVPEYRIFFAGGQILEVDIDYREAHLARRNPRDPTTKNRRSPQDHPPPVDCPIKLRVRKKTVILIPPNGDAPTGAPIKTMDGNPLGQSKDLSLDDQVEKRTDCNNPAKVNYHDMDLRLWTAAPRTKLKKVDAMMYKKFFLGMPTKTMRRHLTPPQDWGESSSGETAWLHNSTKAPNPTLNVKRRNEPVAMDTIYGWLTSSSAGFLT